MNVAEAGASASVRQFHAARAAPFWFAESAGNAPEELLKLLNTSDVDGLDREAFELGALLSLIRDARSGAPGKTLEAEIALSRAFLIYVRGARRDPKVGVIYVDAELKPTSLSPSDVLSSAASAHNLPEYIREMRWMSPIYVGLRKAILAHKGASSQELHWLSVNLERARALPPPTKRFVVVNIASQRLTMFEGEKVVGEMKVVGGRPNAQTPLMNAFIRHAVLNPYWNVPADLSAGLAANVLRRGPAYLREQGYEVLTSLDPGATRIEPASVDWKAVASGQRTVQLRQLPGPANSMGRVKFMFPNPQGIWLHDTPSREHFSESARMVSSGCVRLEDAWRLGSWLLGRPITPKGQQAEQRVELPQPVPLYITYLTRVVEGGGLKSYPDVYQRDLPPPDIWKKPSS